jgi:DNA adenine methylase
MDWANVPESLHAVLWRLQGVTIENKHAFEVIAQQDSPETLFYVDPPYPHFTRASHCKDQYAFELDTRDHVRLARLLNGIKGKAVVSSYPNGLYDELYAGWRTDSREHSKSSQLGRAPSVEKIWMNF